MRRFCSFRASSIALLALASALAAPASFAPSTSLAAPLLVADEVACAPDNGSGSITGTVVGPAALPVRNVVVEAYTPYGQRAGAAVTNASGVYTITKLISGNYLLRFDTSSTGSSLLGQWYSNQSSGLTATPVLLNTGATDTNINATLAEGAQFRGALTGQGGSVLRYTSVNVYDSSGQRVAGAYSDASGVYTTTPGLPPGGYRLFSDPGRGNPYLPQYYSGKPTLKAADVLSVTTSGLISNINMVFERGGQIGGRVTSAATGAGLPNISYGISGDDASDYGFTDSNGYYTSTAGLPNGSYKIEFYPTFESQNFVRASQAVTISAPTLVSGVNAVLGPGSVLVGRVTETGGAPIRYASVYLSNQDGSFQDYFSTDATGTYTATGLSSGVYRAFFRDNKHVSQTYKNRPGYDYQLAQPITVTAPLTVTGIDAVMEPGAVVTGRLTDSVSGAPVAGVFVEVLDQNGGRAETAFSDATGAYTTDATLASGTYKVVFNPDDRNASCAYVREYYDDKRDEAQATPITLTAPITTTNINAGLTKGGSIFGRVTDATTGAPLTNIIVSALDANGKTISYGRTSALGGYLISPGLPSGSYKLRFSDYDGGYIDEFYNNQLSFESANSLTLTAPNNLTGIDAALTKGGTLSGRVTSAASGLPVRGVSVIVHDNDGKEVAYGYSQQDGSYKVTAGLPTGSYRLEFQPPSSAREEGLVASLAQASESGAGYMRMFYPNQLTLDSATPVQVTAPNDTSGLDATLRRGQYLAFISQ